MYLLNTLKSNCLYFRKLSSCTELSTKHERGEKKQCMAAPGRLQGRAAILCFCALGYLFFVFSNQPRIIIGAVLRVAHNGRSYAQCGIAWLRPYQPRQTLPAGTELAKPLKPALRMSCCWLLGFIFSF
jgi:hypothetical protein